MHALTLSDLILTFLVDAAPMRFTAQEVNDALNRSNIGSDSVNHRLRTLYRRGLIHRETGPGEDGKRGTLPYLYWVNTKEGISMTEQSFDSPEVAALKEKKQHDVYLPIETPRELHPDTASLVHSFTAALAGKLLKSQSKYGLQNDWKRNNWKEQCQQELLEHLQKGDPLDVAAYAAFCWHHSWSTAVLQSTEESCGASTPMPQPDRKTSLLEQNMQRLKDIRELHDQHTAAGTTGPVFDTTQVGFLLDMLASARQAFAALTKDEDRDTRRLGQLALAAAGASVYPEEAQ